jgi:crossover junction endodeoxyribonuclease RuvC
MIILGIDPGLRTTGFGVIRQQGHKLSYIASGTIKTPDADLPQRLKTILAGVSEIIRTYAPDCAAIEKVFVNVNPQSTLLLGQARGAAICAQAVVGQGKAQKQQVQDMVQRLLMLSGMPSTDAADALGVAICHAHSGEILSTLSGLAPALAKKGLRMRRGRLIG